MALPTYKDIVDLLKKGATVEAQEQIMTLREGALALQEENLALREKIKTLEEAVRIKSQLKFEGSVYWMYEGSSKDGPFCQHCYDTSGKLIRLQHWDDAWMCLSCRNPIDKNT